LQADEAQLAFLRQELADAQLIAPVDAVVRARLMEPGEATRLVDHEFRKPPACLGQIFSG
jgi:hypothetical protein